MNCRDFQEIADSYLSDELLTETNHEMIRHMEACADCRNLIGARREIRGRLRSAVIASPEFRLDEGFDHRLLTSIKQELGRDQQSGSWFGMRMFAMAAGLLVVAMLSLALFTNLNGPAASSDYLVSGFADESLVNIASGDHQYCAINYSLEEAPVALSSGDPRFAGLDDLVKKELGTALSDHKVVEAHACKYKNVRFAHLVLKGPNDTLSVLVTPTDQEAGAINERIAEYSSSLYEVSSFMARDNSVFVISDLSKEMNRKAAEALKNPLQEHFSANGGSIETAMLKMHVPATFASFRE